MPCDGNQPAAQGVVHNLFHSASCLLLYLSVRGVDWVRVWKTVAGASWTYLAVTASLMVFSFFMRARSPLRAWRLGERMYWAGMNENAAAQ
jgi:uncharacterized membrane protein YbhN (UPF0104 family)